MDELNYTEAVNQNNTDSPLLFEVRNNFGIYSAISLTFGGAFALLFYKAWAGINILLYATIIIGLLSIVMTRLTPKIKKGTKLYFTGVLLLGASSVLTSNSALIFMNVIGILILLDLSLLHQFNNVHQWDFAYHLGNMIGLFFVSLISIWMPFSDCVDYFRKTRALKNDLLRNVLIGVAISIPILFITIGLLSSADMLFGDLSDQIFDAIFSENFFGIGFMVIFGALSCYCVLCGITSMDDSESMKIRKKADASIAATVMILLSVVYSYFCFLQIFYLFSGGLFTLPEGYSFAEYARRGFFELMWVTGINIGIMIICQTFFKESKILSILITFLTICTYIMIGSATYRMILYIGAYYLTFLRMLVLLILIMEIFILAGVIISGFTKAFPLFTYCVAVVSIFYIAFSFSKPDVWIATYLMNQKDTLNLEDMNYLTSELSLDAAPVILPVLSDKTRWDNDWLSEKTAYDTLYEFDDWVSDYYHRIEKANEGYHIRDFNYSNYRANEIASIIFD